MDLGERSLRDWQRLLEPACADLVDAAEVVDPGDVKAVERLRRDWPADLVAAALDLASARHAAAGKFPVAATLVADRAGVEQATSHVVAEHKAQRFRALAPGRVLDLCCGIGGDAMSLARVTAVEGIDASPLRAWMCHCNAGCPTRTADVTTLALRDDVFHLDPARRFESGPRRGRRAWRVADYEPGPDFLRDLAEHCPDGAVKLGPGVDLESLPPADGREIEMISEHGRLVQAVLWLGRLAAHPDHHTATLLPEGATLTGPPAHPPAAPGGAPRRYLLEPDAAAERARLLGPLCEELGAEELHPGLGLLCTDRLEPDPWVRRFEVLDVLPLRPRRVRSRLRELGAGVVEVKTRGQAVDPDRMQIALRGRGEERLTVFLLRLGTRKMAFITRRLPGDEAR